MPATDVEIYLQHVESLLGLAATSFDRVGSSDPQKAPISMICFEGHPTPESLVVVTYGLSLSYHPNWTRSRRELMLCVDSLDKAWGFAMAEIAEQFRGDCPFAHGNIVKYGGPISQESAMSAFLMFAPSLSATSFVPEQLAVTLEHYPVTLQGAYPIYAGEQELIESIGLKAFWHLDEFDPWDVGRPDLSRP